MEHYLKIAEMKTVKGQDTIKTVVGSCIALCLWDKEQSIGGMVHIMMPRNNGDKSSNKGKYADTAVGALLEEIVKKGCRKENITARIIGGASMFGNNTSSVLSIGRQNCEVVKKHLKQLNIPIKSEETGGESGRRVVFECATGMAVIKTLSESMKE